MAINQPHEGGLHMLNLVFGTAAKPTDPYTVYFYVAPITPALSFDDDDTQEDGTPNNLPCELTDLSEAGYSTCYSSVTPTNLDFVPADLDDGISTTNNVPEIEFPEVSITFTAALPSPHAGESIHGYAIVCGDDAAVIFRELFPSLITPADGVVVRFTPIFRMGNTTCVLT